MGEELADEIRSLARDICFKPGEYILREGQVCNRACLIAKGLTRSFYIIDGIDITSRFMQEGHIVTSWMSYYSQQPGNEFIEALEDTTMICLYYNDIQQLFTRFPEFNIVGRKQAEFAFYLSEQRTQLLRKHTAEEKYRLFLEYHPNLLQRVSLKHVATYLGMNEETLSRVRSRYNKNNS